MYLNMWNFLPEVIAHEKSFWLFFNTYLKSIEEKNPNKQQNQTKTQTQNPIWS